jgi:hypothetical protein
MTSSSGRCLCGAVEFTAEDADTQHSACHCGMCRRWSGGAPFFAARTRSVTFASEDAIGRYSSSAWAERGFCKECGTTLFYFLKPTKTYMMSVGAFDDAERFRLSVEIFVDRKPQGYELAGSHPRWTEAETLERLAPK